MLLLKPTQYWVHGSAWYGLVICWTKQANGSLETKEKSKLRYVSQQTLRFWSRITWRCFVTDLFYGTQDELEVGLDTNSAEYRTVHRVGHNGFHKVHFILRNSAVNVLRVLWIYNNSQKKHNSSKYQINFALTIFHCTIHVFFSIFYLMNNFHTLLKLV